MSLIFTARQLEEQLKRDGQVTLPYRARLTPLAQDWIRQRGIKIGYSDVAAPEKEKSKPAEVIGSSSGGRWMWWADGPCGPAKAALLTVARETNLQTIEVGVDSKRIVEAVKVIADEVRNQRAQGGIMMVSTGALAMLYANRCPSLRAVLGTCLEAVEQGVRLVAANLLVIEHPYKTLQQTKTLLARFVRGRRELSDDVVKQLSELSSCG
jgi:ribose 5-phosphate isomerase RpiB